MRRATSLSPSDEPRRRRVGELPLSANSNFTSGQDVSAPRKTRLRSKVEELAGADLRSLAVFRMAVASVALVDLAVRLGNLRAHYSDDGVLPREQLLRVPSLTEWRWSVLFASGIEPFLVLVFGIGLLAALAMLVGHRTRLATCVVWIVVLSLHARNPYLNTGGDNLLRLMLMWSIFLPLGARWSVDRRGGGSRGRSPLHVSLGTIGLFVQIALMYLMTAYLKSGAAWHDQATAIHYALGLGHYTRPFGEWLWQFSGLLQMLTRITIWLEWLAPILLFSPVFTGPVRTLAAASIAGLHLGIWLTLDIGIFPWIASLSMLVFLPSWFWDVVCRIPRPTRRVVAARSAWQRLSDALPSRRRMSAGKAEAFPGADARPGDTGISMRRAVINLAAGALLVYVLLLNLRTVSDYELPERLEPVEHLLYLRQNWAMFAPEPSRAAVWYTMPGTLENGDRVDVLPAIVNGDMSRFRAWTLEPDYLAFENKQWRQYLGSLRASTTTARRSELAAFACREWNAAHDGEWRLSSVQYGVVREPTLETPSHGNPDLSLSETYSCS